MKTLFNEYEAYTPEANTLDGMVEKALKPIVLEFHAKGYSFREIELVCDSAVRALICTEVLKYASNRRQEKRNRELRLNNGEITS